MISVTYRVNFYSEILVGGIRRYSSLPQLRDYGVLEYRRIPMLFD